jgi:hypothetical protein
LEQNLIQSDLKNQFQGYQQIKLDIIEKANLILCFLFHIEKNFQYLAILKEKIEYFQIDFGFQLKENN